MVSVAMATYNGERYLRRQIETVFMNLAPEDELVISDDGSTDQTLSIIQSFDDARIRLFSGPQKGINANFSNAIAHCTGDYIFLCDQDDIWHPNKVQRVLETFREQNCLLVEHDAVVADCVGNTIYPSFFDYRKVRSGFMRNIIRNTYHGCCMAFSAELKSRILPIPNGGFLHDQWIGLVAERSGKCVFLKELLMEYQRYESNASSFHPHPFHIQLRNRIQLCLNLGKRLL